MEIYPRSYRSQPGFTLFELLVVIVIMSLALSVVVPRIGNSISQGDIENAVRKLTTSMRLARSEAIRSRQPVNFYVDVERRLYWSSKNGKRQTLPDYAIVELFTARSQLQDDGSGYIRFFPDGSASGGSITLTAAEASRSIEVNWLTGNISLASEHELAGS